MKFLIVLSCFVAAALCAGEPKYEQEIPIVRSESHFKHDGTYKYGYETGHGIQVQEHGYIKNAGVKDAEIKVAEGFYSYPGPDGHPISVSYIADENGFQPVGDHLPTPPPIPKEIQEALLHQQQYGEQEEEEQHHHQQQNHHHHHQVQEQPEHHQQHQYYKRNSN